MSSKGDDQPPHAGLWVTLILLLCAFSLAAHAIGEWQGPAAAQPASEMTNQGGQVHPTVDGEADELLTTRPGSAESQANPSLPVAQAPSSSWSIQIPPLPLPPNPQSKQG